MRKLVSAVALLLLCAPAGLAQLHVDYQAAPPTTEALFADADAVALVQITGRTEIAAAGGRLRTDYGVIVLEKFKGDASVPAHGPGLMIKRRGGLTPATAEIGFESFEPGDKYVLFLKRQRDVEGFAPSFGPDGAIRVEPNGQLHPLGAGPVSRQHLRKPAAQLLAKLRDLAG